MLKRFTMVVTVMMLALSGMTGAKDGGDKNEGNWDKADGAEQTVIRSRTFNIPADKCGQLPTGVTLTGLGVERTTTTVSERGKNGLRGTVVNEDHGHG